MNIITFLNKIDSAVTILDKDWNDSTITTLDRNKYDEGWVDTGTIISFKDAIKKLKSD